MLGLIEHLYNKKAIAYAMTPEMNLLIPEVGFEPTRPQRTLDFESSASASSATPAKNN